jgi:hypothetical protein
MASMQRCMRYSAGVLCAAGLFLASVFGAGPASAHEGQIGPGHVRWAARRGGTTGELQLRHRLCGEFRRASGFTSRRK